jgi:hypothetical protein
VVVEEEGERQRRGRERGGGEREGGWGAKVFLTEKFLENK